MNPLMAEILAKERSQRREHEIVNRQRINKAKAKKRSKINLFAPLKKLSSSLGSENMKKPKFKGTPRTSEALD